MAPPRRASDNEGEDYMKARRSGGVLNGHTKWVVTVVSSGIIAIASWLLVNDRTGVERRLENGEKRDAELHQAINQALQTQAVTAVNVGAIQATLAEIKADVKEVRKELRR